MEEGDEIKMLKLKIEEKRKQLHNILENGRTEDIVRFSQELDVLINIYNKNSIKTKRDSC